jgi:hypothetical protein
MDDARNEPGLSPEEMADLEEVCRLVAQGRRAIDPELLKRVRAQSDKLHRATLQKYGLVEWVASMDHEAWGEDG